MRGFGVAVLIVGVLWLMIAINMDVSVGTGSGRVNNFGLMAERSNQTMIGGMVALAGLLMLIFGGKKSPASHYKPVGETLEYANSRTCPYCAETIKRAALKCKHCGSDVEPIAEIAPSHGWTVRIPCRPEEADATGRIIANAGFPVLPPDGFVLVVGFYGNQQGAKAAQQVLRESHRIHGDLYLPQLR